MDELWKSIVVTIVVVVALVQKSSAIWCFECTSSQPGCGMEVDWKLQKWHWCTSYHGQPAMCVKYKEISGASERYVRGCVNKLFENTFYRHEIPSTIRQNYCVTSKSTGNKVISRDEDVKKAKQIFCFCNSNDGCNSTTWLRGHFSTVLLASVMSLLVLRAF